MATHQHFVSVVRLNRTQPDVILMLEQYLTSFFMEMEAVIEIQTSLGSAGECVLQKKPLNAATCAVNHVCCF